MHHPLLSRSLLLRTLFVGSFLSAAALHAGPVWFDPTQQGQPYGSFADLQKAYNGFVGVGGASINFAGLAEGTKLGDQFAADYGLHFLNTGGGRYDWASGVRPESGANVEDLTGYDGSYRPNGQMVYLKFDNNVAATPFTILFNQPVAQVGSFVAMGKEGDVHSLTISVYDAGQQLLGRQVIDAWLWDKTTDRQNYETFFALRLDAPLISRVEILNNSMTDFSNALTVDSIQFSSVEKCVPEPAVLAMFVIGGWVISRRRLG